MYIDQKKETLSILNFSIFSEDMGDSSHTPNTSWILQFTNFSKNLWKNLTQVEWTSCSRQLDVFSLMF